MYKAQFEKSNHHFLQGMSLILGFFLLASSSVFAQQTTFKGAFLEKWENSKNYLIEIAEAMPEHAYGHKPTERQKSFKEQLVHIQEQIEWLGSAHFSVKKSRNSQHENVKQSIIENIAITFDDLAIAVKNLPEEDLKIVVDFFAGNKSKLQILNLLQDHVTHHRGQIIVYLNLKGIKPPRYIGW